MVNSRQLATDTLLYGATEVVNRAVPFLLLPILTRYLTPGDFGIAAILAAMSVFLAPVFSLGLGASIAPCYFCQSTMAGKRSTIVTALSIVLLSSVLLLVCSAWSLDWLSFVSFGRHGEGRFVLLGVLSTVFSMIAIPFRQFFQFERRAGLYVTLSSVAAVASASLTVLLVVMLRRGVLGLIEATALGQAVTCALFALAYCRQPGGRFERELAVRMLRVGLPLIPGFASVFVLQQASKYLLQWTHGLSEVGIFSVGFNAGLVLSVVITGFQAAWIPFFMSYVDRPNEAALKLGQVVTYFTYLFGGLSLLMYAIAKPLIALLTTAQFQPSWRVVGLSASAQFLNGVFVVLLPGMYFRDEVQYVGMIQSVAAVAGLTLNWYLVGRFGFVGAAIAIVLSYVLLDVLLYGWNRYREYVRVCYETRRLMTFGVFYVAFAGAFSVGRQASVTIELGAALVGGVAVAVFIVTQLTAGERSTLMTYLRASTTAFSRILNRRSTAAAVVTVHNRDGSR